VKLTDLLPYILPKAKDYSDPNGALLALSEWNEAIADAKADALTGLARATTRTSKVWF
jgi:hypothetical protein